MDSVARPYVMEEFETVRYLKDNRASIGRFGDGELRMVCGSALKFQKADAMLAHKLRAIVSDGIHSIKGATQPNFIVGIPRAWGRRDLAAYDPIKATNWLTVMNDPKNVALLNPKGTYASAFITRPDSAIHIECDHYWDLIRSLWVGRSVVYFNGDEPGSGKAGKGTKRGMLDGVERLEWITCPKENAWAARKQIVAKALTFPKDTLMLLSLGPTATVLAYFLWQEGYQALDIGHLPMFYNREHPKYMKTFKEVAQ